MLSIMDMKNLETRPFRNSKPGKHTRSRNISVTDSENEGSWESDDDEYTYSLKKPPPKKDSSDVRFKVLIVAFLIVVLALIATIIWQQFHIRTNSECMTEDCVKTSAIIMTKMNKSVDPCEDFYKYACGGWIKNVFVPPDKGKVGAFSEAANHNQDILKKLLDEDGEVFKGKNSTAIRKSKIYYRTCLNQTKVKQLGTTPVLQYINELGSWTVTSDSVSGTWKASSWDFVDALVRIHLQNSVPLFKLSVSPDDRNNSQNVISFKQDGLTLSDHHEYIGNISEKFHNAFMSFGTKFGKLLGGNESVVKSKMADIYELEKKISECFMTQADLQDPSKYYNMMTLEEFQSILGDKAVFDVKKYVDKLFKDDVPITEKVLVLTLDYFKKLGDIIKNTSAETMNNYLVWSVVQYTVGYLPDAFVKAALSLSKVESGTTGVSPLWQRCVYKTNQALGFATSALFVQERFTPDTKQKVEEILDEIKHAFLKNLQRVTWMDSETRQKAEEKVKAVRNMIGYPDFIMDSVLLDRHYENLTIVDGQFFRNYINSAVWGYQQQIDKRRKPPDRTKWNMMPYQVNAYYSISWNQIVVPAGILQQPFFEPTFPQAVNFGSLGLVLGHELTHGFDSKGKNYDKNGNMKNWWTNSSAEEFSEKAKCLENQYSNYVMDGIQLNGVQTLAENIADNGGLQTAYMAYKMNTHAQTSQPLPAIGLSNDQIFFVSFAQVWCGYYRPAFAKRSVLIDPHAIAEFRVKGSVSNSDDFASAYNCPVGSPMNPKEKCHMW